MAQKLKVIFDKYDVQRCKNNIQINKHTPLVNTIKSYDSNKNIFIGNTKYDNIPSKDEIYQKFHLNKNQKYIFNHTNSAKKYLEFLKL